MTPTTVAFSVFQAYRSFETKIQKLGVQCYKRHMDTSSFIAGFWLFSFCGLLRCRQIDVGLLSALFVSSDALHVFRIPIFFKEMVFASRAGCEWRNPKRSQRERSLASALSTIIWRAGDGNTGEKADFTQQ